MSPLVFPDAPWRTPLNFDPPVVALEKLYVYSTVCLLKAESLGFLYIPGDLQSKGLRTAFQMQKKIAPEDSMLKC